MRQIIYLLILLALPFGLKAEERACPICGHCIPEDFSGSASCTLAGCDCCNECTAEFTCMTTNHVFVATWNECDWVKWVVSPSPPKAQDAIYDTVCCEGKLTYHDFQYFLNPCPCDPERFYFTVDTCLTCPDGYDLTGELSDGTGECWPRNWADTTLHLRWFAPDTTITTVVHRKVQGWWTPDELKKLKEMVK